MNSRQSLAWVCLAVAAAWGLAVPCTGQQAEKARTLVRAGHVLDVKTGKLADAQTIVVVGDSIESIGPTASVQTQPGDVVVDLSSMTVMPGLIDVHTHLTMNTDFDPYRELTCTDAKEAINGVVNARTTLMAGFTFDAERGGERLHDVDLRDAINAGQIAGTAHAGQRTCDGDHRRSLRRQPSAGRSTTSGRRCGGRNRGSAAESARRTSSMART